jgi:hypothetical protein
VGGRYTCNAMIPSNLVSGSRVRWGDMRGISVIQELDRTWEFQSPGGVLPRQCCGAKEITRKRKGGFNSRWLWVY